MNLNLFNMIRSVAGVIFTDVQIVQSLGIWSIFKLALKFFWHNPSSLICGLPKYSRLILEISCPNVESVCSPWGLVILVAKDISVPKSAC